MNSDFKLEYMFNKLKHSDKQLFTVDPTNNIYIIDKINTLPCYIIQITITILILHGIHKSAIETKLVCVAIK